MTKALEYGGATTTLGYDANGNLAWEEGMTGARTTYTWDPENRLGSVTLPSGSVQTNRYPRDGRRIRQTTDGVVRAYAWDALNVLLEADAALAIEAQYTDYPGYWGGLASQRRDGATSYYGFDFQGATRILVSTGGIVTDSATFNAWGEVVAQSGTTTNPYG